MEEDHTYVANGVVVHNCFVLPIEDDTGYTRPDRYGELLSGDGLEADETPRRVVVYGRQDRSRPEHSPSPCAKFAVKYTI